MALHATPEQHAANPPESWRIVRVAAGSRARWHLFVDGDAVNPAQYYITKADATAALTSGFYFDLYQKEGRWFAGETVSGWKGYAEIQAEKTASSKAAARKVERMGTTVARLNDWRAETSSETFGVVQNAAEEMGTLLNSGDLLDPDLLDEGEARELYRSLAEAWGFGSPVYDRIYRIKYGGFDGDKTALEVLEEMEQEEREEARQTPIKISH